MEINKAELIKLTINAKNGDKNAFERLYSILFEPLYRYIFYKTTDKFVAEDIVQQTFVKVFEHVSTLEPNKYGVTAYFYTVAKNLLTDNLRKQRPVFLDETVELAAKEAEPSAQFERDYNAKLLRDAITSLSEEQQDILDLRFACNMSFKEIAVTLEKSEENVRQINHRTMQKLSEKLKELNY